MIASVLLTLLLYALTGIFAPLMPIGLKILVMLAFLLAICYIVYQQIREEVRVNDLLTGRDFKARSLVQLLVRENRIRKMSGVFAIVIEQARTWHEPEVIPIVPQPLGITLAPTPEGHYEVT